jgi:hypothetical protein
MKTAAHRSAARARRGVVSTINRGLERFGVHVVRTELGVGPRRLRASLTAFQACGGVVAAGPFRGMVVADQFAWGDANAGAVVLGCYEEQLHDSIEELIASSPDLVVNIGSAEGTYTVGLARRLPQARLLAVDIEPAAEQALTANAQLNGVAGQVSFRLGMTPRELEKELHGARNPAVVIDCEGCEVDFIDPVVVPALSRCHLLVEVHSGIRPGALEVLHQRLTSTHTVDEIMESGRNPHSFRQLRAMPSVDKWLVVCEGRNETMTWLWCRPRSSGPAMAR